jgi:hypothetical protein
MPGRTVSFEYHHMRDVLTFLEYLPVEACVVDAKDVASSQAELHMIHEL